MQELFAELGQVVLRQRLLDQREQLALLELDVGGEPRAELMQRPERGCITEPPRVAADQDVVEQCPHDNGVGDALRALIGTRNATCGMSDSDFGARSEWRLGENGDADDRRP